MSYLAYTCCGGEVSYTSDSKLGALGGGYVRSHPFGVRMVLY